MDEDSLNFLLRLIDTRPDLTLEEMKNKLILERGVTVSPSTPSLHLQATRGTFNYGKKNWNSFQLFVILLLTRIVESSMLYGCRNSMALEHVFAMLMNAVSAYTQREIVVDQREDCLLGGELTTNGPHMSHYCVQFVQMMDLSIPQ